MSSTNLDAPSNRLKFTAVVAVVGLHALTAVALAVVKTPEIKEEPIQETQPIEIDLITPPQPPAAVEPEQEPAEPVSAP
ncbi:MAG: hypothetical protein ACTHWG_02635, partial [Psychrobacter sp.]